MSFRDIDDSGDPTWISGNLYGTGLDYMSSSNPMYDAYYKANPYVGQTYKKTWVDRIFGNLFRTPYDKWLDEMKINAAQYNAGVVDMQQQNFYNSEVAKADRMRSAGENPDILGTAGVSDSATSTPDPQDAQIPDALDGSQILNVVSQVGMSMIDLIPKTMSFMTSLSSLRGIRMDNDLKELTFNSDIEKYVKDFFATGVTKQDYQDAFSSEDFENLLTASEKNSDDLALRLFSSPRSRKLFKMNYGRYARSLVAEMSKYKSYEDFEEAREAITKTRASQYFDDDDQTQISLIKAVLGPFERYQKRMYELQEKIANLRKPNLEQGLANQQMQNQLAYESSLDPALQAQTENAGNEYQKQLYEIQKYTDDMFAEMMRNLDALGSWYSPIAKALLGVARAQLLSGFHGSFQRQSYQKVDGDTGVVTDETRSNFGVNF